MPGQSEPLSIGRISTKEYWQIVLPYKHRWDIGKIFHQFKSKMGERKSWASSRPAKQSHAIFQCLAHILRKIPSISGTPEYSSAIFSAALWISGVHGNLSRKTGQCL